MLRIVILLFLSVAGMWGQDFYAAGGSFLPQSSPKPSGWAVTAKEVNVKNKLYSFTETDYTYVAGKVQSSVRTGMATPLRSFGKFTLYGLADAGVATVGTSTGSAYAGGGVVLWPIGKTSFNLVFGVRELKTSLSTQTLIEIGLGRK